MHSLSSRALCCRWSRSASTTRPEYPVSGDPSPSAQCSCECARETGELQLARCEHRPTRRRSFAAVQSPCLALLTRDHTHAGSSPTSLNLSGESGSSPAASPCRLETVKTHRHRGLLVLSGPNATGKTSTSSEGLHSTRRSRSEHGVSAHG